MRMSWQPERERLVCRWSGVGERVRYNPHWMQEAPALHKVAAPSFLDFTRLCPFGGRRWFDPNRGYGDPEVLTPRI
jgi:hypothetical protein